MDDSVLFVFRQMRIIENTLTDTISVGFSIVVPGEIRNFIYRRTGENSGSHPEQPLETLPKTYEICVNKYKGRSVNGGIKIQYWY